MHIDSNVSMIFYESHIEIMRYPLKKINLTGQQERMNQPFGLVFLLVAKPLVALQISELP